MAVDKYINARSLFEKYLVCLRGLRVVDLESKTSSFKSLRSRAIQGKVTPHSAPDLEDIGLRSTDHTKQALR